MSDRLEGCLMTAFVGSIVIGLLALVFIMGIFFAVPCSKDCDSQEMQWFYIPLPALHYPIGGYPNYDGPATGTYKHYYQESGGEEPGVTQPKNVPPGEVPPEEHPVEPIEPHIVPEGGGR